MSRYLPPILVFVLFLVESIWFQTFVSPDQPLQFIPRLAMVLLVMIGIFRGPLIAAVYGLGLGLLYDVVFTDVLGIYMFTCTFIAYLFSISLPVIKQSMLYIVVIAIVAFAAFETLVYGLYSVVGVTTMEGDVFFQSRLVPSLLINGGFALLIVYPVRNLMKVLLQREGTNSV
ncbi:rod shape-determining protein MreD [Salsuginibacillus kocurii]|uniref:rod shape-determining protein MreD n=1 Tax=Salsuginibacillus kocurii TaxID=427078 RepID=UPI000365F8B5|nr:rod shape-determining protein MreD [Salsuginibacillus kocurii]